MWFAWLQDQVALRSRSDAAKRRPPAQRWSFRPRVLDLEDRLLLSTYVVTNVADSGAGSLRAALTAVNAHQDTTITFQIPGSGVHTIQPHSALPAVTVPVTIDGTTQSGYAGLPLIELDGSLAGATDGLDINGGSSVVKGLAVNRFAWAGIALTYSNGNSLQGDFIGTDPTGTLARGNGGDGVDVIGSNNLIGAADGSQSTVISGNGQNGIYIAGDSNRVFNCAIGTDVSTSAALGNRGNGVGIVGGNNTIGSSLSTNGNVISANGGTGVVSVASLQPNLVAGNLIGTDGSGAVALGNQGSGVLAYGTGGTTIGGPTPDAANVIAGNAKDGITIQSTFTDIQADANVVESDLIGTDLTGSYALGNGGYGVAIVGDAHSNNIGGQASVGNIIAANALGGIEFADDVIVSHQGSRLVMPTHNQVIANYIGTDVSGEFALGNGGDGIDINQTNSNTIGGTAPGTGNLISSNVGTGITIAGGVAMRSQLGISNVVEGNTIGTDAAVSYSLGNGGDGVQITWAGASAAGSNQVGGTAAGAGNLIAFNGGDGVHVLTSTHNPIQENIIYGSGNLGIELSSNGNDNQAPPTLTSASSNGSNLTVQGTFQGTASTTYSLDLFANDACNPSGYGEGQYYLGTATVQTDSSGHANFNVTLPGVSVSPGQFLSATVTAPNGDTSSFSACLAYSGTGPAAAHRPPLADVVRASAEVAPIPQAAVPVSVRQAAVDHVFMQAAADLVGRAAQDQPETAADFFVLAARAQPAEAALVEALAPRFDLVLA